MKLIPSETLEKFVIKIEVSHSTDFNDFYPESAQEGDGNYSGGSKGSGQPALVYAAGIDLSSGRSLYEAILIGHSSPDGTSGTISPDLSGMTTALQIVERITIMIQ